MVNRLNAKNKLTGNEVVFVIIMTFIAAAIFCVLCQFVYYANANVENVQLNFVQYLCFSGVILSIFAALVVFIYCNDVELLKDKRKLLALFTSMIISLAIIIAITNISDIGYSIYFAPLALCTLLCAMLTNSRVSYFANIVVLVIFNIAEIRFTSISGAELYYPLINGVITGIIGSFSISKYNRRAQYLLSGSITGFVSIFIATITLLLFGDGAIGDIKAYMFICLFSLLSGLINTALFFLLIPLIENVLQYSNRFQAC
jgi:Predicted membrane-associated HD superfamily hydrolase